MSDDSDEIREYERRVWASTVSEHQTPVYAALGLAGEAGEYVDHVKKTFFHARPLDGALVLEELSDVLWYLTLAARLEGLSLRDLMARSLRKLDERYPQGFDYERARARAWEADDS